MVKKILGTIVVLLIIGGGIWLIVDHSSNKSQPPTTKQQQTFDPKNPNFVLGTVIAADPDKMSFSVDGKTYTANIAVSTVLIKQVKDNSGGYHNVDAQPKEFAKGTKIVVYFSKPAANNIYDADKIQIVP